MRIRNNLIAKRTVLNTITCFICS